MEKLTKPLARGGDAIRGYEIGVDRALRLMQILVWGFWQAPIADSFRAAATAGMEVMAKGGPWFLTIDVRRYPSQQEAIQQSHVQVLDAARIRGVVRAACIVESEHSHMQFRRLCRESGLAVEFFTKEPHALAWLGSGEI